MLVSAVIPTYNRAADIVVAVESVLAQTYKDVEILVCDDGSKDNTAEVLEPYKDRIRYLRKPNGGVSSARNLGIEHARGEAVALLDSDDEWMPDKLEQQVAILKARPEIGMVLTGYVQMGPDRKLFPNSEMTRREDYPRDGHILTDVIRMPMLCPSSVLIRTQVARDLGGFDTNLRTAEDIDFNLRVARRHGIALVAKPLMKYMRNPNGLGSEARTYRDYVFVMERFLGSCTELSKEDLRAAYLAMYIKNARGLAYFGEISHAAELSLKGLPLLRKPKEIAALAKVGAMMGRHLAQQMVKRVTNR